MSMDFKKIVSKDKSFISRDDTGQIWLSEDGRSFISAGTIYNGICNIHKPCTLDSKYDDYFAVHVKLLRFSERFDIKELRLIKPVSKLEKQGWVQKLVYGYVPGKRFEKLLKSRKHKICHDKHNEYVLLKEKDAEWKDA